ncbi:MAG: beta-mannanase [Ruminococcaceae bacterium]|nr:beta-mannanase [Oscillospiraceae bacterium]
MKKNQELFESGKFFVGVNYWASHAGMFMWRNWDADVVEKDFKQLSEEGIEVLRVFPLWPDFQPLRLHQSGGSVANEYRHGEEPFPFTEAGKCGVDQVMADRFEVFCDLAEKYNLKLIVGLITGWMSGRTFVPESLVGRQPLKDHGVMKWEIRFVRYMVRRFKDHPAIGAWDLGNECNCLGDANHDDAFVWASVITNTVRSEDRVHPVVSGMHGLRPEGQHPWSMADQSEILDILCTHPYPMFTGYCNTDPLNTMKAILHATAESVYFGTMGKKPCFIEEGGTLGPMISSDEVAGDYVRASLFSAWAHDLRGWCWWCAYDQDELTNTPYDWDPVERELGMHTFNGTKKPVMDEFTSFRKFIDEYPYDKLPERLKDATCILTSGQEQWPVAYGTFILAKQAGLDVEFTWYNEEIPESDVYLMPCVSSNHAISKRAMDTIMERVERGATLYISLANGVLTHFKDITGLYLITRNETPSENGNTNFTLDGEDFSIRAPYRYVVDSVGAEVLIKDASGNPFFTVNNYGKGKVYFINAPIENIIARTPGALVDGKQVPYFLRHSYYKLYEMLDIKNKEKIADCKNSSIGVTEHPVSETERIINVVNYCPYDQSETITLEDGWKFDSIISASRESTGAKAEGGFTVTLPANTGASIVVKR